ncbi:MAG: DUF1295 domain-containing protein, partial [Deltaproteobacteria bacterium]|nr:DUF1295 domain-containing protein [Deltaproteobacteria bacterium]
MEISFLYLLIFSIFFISLIWILAEKIQNYSIVDIGWAGGFFINVWICYFFSEGWIWRRVLISILVTCWSLRLAFHLAKRIFKLHPVEEGRYQTLRKKWKPKLKIYSFVFFQLQGLLLAILSIPFIIISQNSNIGFSILEFGGFFLFGIALLGESIADAQLQSFKKLKKNGESVCQKGFWNYSRHPNYFFEWLIWVSLFFISLPASWGWTTCFAPLL